MKGFFSDCALRRCPRSPARRSAAGPGQAGPGPEAPPRRGAGVAAGRTLSRPWRTDGREAPSFVSSRPWARPRPVSRGRGRLAHPAREETLSAPRAARRGACRCRVGVGRPAFCALSRLEPARDDEGKGAALGVGTLSSPARGWTGSARRQWASVAHVRPRRGGRNGGCARSAAENLEVQ